MDEQITNDFVPSSSRSSFSDVDVDVDVEQKSEDNYIIQTKMCSRLSRELGLCDIVVSDKIDYEPPKEAGLSNSDVIIPSYYHIHKNPNKIQNINYLNMIKDDIRNLRPLNKYKLEYIYNLPNEDKNEIITLFNECINVFNELMK